MQLFAQQYPMAMSPKG